MLQDHQKANLAFKSFMLQIQNPISIKIQYSKKLNVQMFTQMKNKYKYQMYRKLSRNNQKNIVELKAMFNIAISWEVKSQRHCGYLNETVPNHFEMNIL